MVYLIAEGRRDGDYERLLDKTLINKVVSIWSKNELGIWALFEHTYFCVVEEAMLGPTKFIHSIDVDK